MKTFAIVNRKGGVGKTTTAVNLAYVLATSHHLRVLLVDADGQANATQLLLPPGEYAGLGALLRGMVLCYDELTVHTDVSGLDVLPAYKVGRCIRSKADEVAAYLENQAVKPPELEPGMKVGRFQYKPGMKVVSI